MSILCFSLHVINLVPLARNTICEAETYFPSFASFSQLCAAIERRRQAACFAVIPTDIKEELKSLLAKHLLLEIYGKKAIVP